MHVRVRVRQSAHRLCVSRLCQGGVGVATCARLRTACTLARWPVPTALFRTRAPMFVRVLATECAHRHVMAQSRATVEATVYKRASMCVCALAECVCVCVWPLRAARWSAVYPHCNNIATRNDPRTLPTAHFEVQTGPHQHTMGEIL